MQRKRSSGTKRRSERITNSETLSEKLIGALTDCVIVLDLDQRIVEVDARSRQLLGLPDGLDLRGETLSMIWSLDERASSEAFARAGSEGYARLDPLYRHIPAQESAQCWLISVVKEAEGFIVFGRDVTQPYQSGCAALEATGIGLWEIDDRTKTWSCSAQTYKIFGYSQDDIARSKPVSEIIHPADVHLLKEIYRELAAGRSNEETYRILHLPSGEERWIHSWAKPIRSAAGTLQRSVGAVTDITNRKRLEKEYQNVEEQWRLALQGGQMIAWSMDIGGTFYSRSNTINHLGLDAERVAIADLVSRIHPEDRPLIIEFIAGEYTERRMIEYRSLSADNEVRWHHVSGQRVERPGWPSRLMGVTFDITDRKIIEQKLEHAATHDLLTGILNRNAVQNALEDAISKARPSKEQVLLLLLDLDHFKDVNDTLGHEAGDAILKMVAKRIAGVVGLKGAVGRLGGDEFAIVIPSRSRVDTATTISGRIHAALKRPAKFRDKSLDLKACIGVAAFPDHGDNKTDLLKKADLALYTAKNAGRHRTSVFSHSMLQAVEERVLLSRNVKDALAHDQIVPFYQPKIDLATGAVIGLEALARWIHPQRGVLAPAFFISAFEDMNLALAIDDAMVRQVSRDAARWQAEGRDFGRVAINLSSFAFRSPHLVQRIVGMLAQAGLPTRCFEIEVTETVLLDRRSEEVGALLEQFRAQDIKISFDDFGTGYASLTHLKSFPVDEIKIDRSFVRDLETNRQDAAIISALIGLGAQLGMTIVAEGIETQGQMTALRRLDCTNGQGFLFAKPMAASRVPWMLAKSYARDITSDDLGCTAPSSMPRAARREGHQR